MEPIILQLQATAYIAIFWELGALLHAGLVIMHRGLEHLRMLPGLVTGAASEAKRQEDAEDLFHFVTFTPISLTPPAGTG
jgi:hypothetical protein